VAWYRLRVTWTYSTVAAANTAATAIDTTLAAQGRAERVTRPTTSSLEVVVEPLSETESVTLRNALTPQWATGTRTAGKASVVRRDEGSS
jgi:hypothetical protein